jgi:hypothetical protein
MAMPDVAPGVPGVEARAGKFPGPSLIPALHAIQERVGWLPREELVALSREVHRPLYEIEGLISFYPHFRTTPPERVVLRVCHDLSCWLGARTTGSRRSANGTGATPTWSWSRGPASAGATPRRPPPSTTRRCRCPRWTP